MKMYFCYSKFPCRMNILNYFRNTYRYMGC